MNGVTKHPQLWSNAQAYAVAVIALLLGVGVGYLLHSPKNSQPNAPQSLSAAGAVNGPMPSANDLKRMADKKAAPLLAELQEHPKNAQLLAKIGATYFAAQQFQSARQYYEQSLAIKEDPTVLNELSFSYYSLGDVDKAIATLNRALKIDPKNPKVLFNLGMLQWYGRSDSKAAIAAWEAFIKTNPNDPKRAEVERMIARGKQHLNIPPGTKTNKPAM